MEILSKEKLYHLLTLKCSIFAELSLCQSTTYTNPIIKRNHPDPGVLSVPGKSGYVLVSTSNLNSPDNGPAFPIMFSYDLVNWERKGYVFNTGEWPSWAQVWSQIFFFQFCFHFHNKHKKQPMNIEISGYTCWGKG